MDLKSKFFRSMLFCMAVGLMATSCSDKDEPDNDPDDYDSSEVIYVSEGNFDYDSDGVWDLNYDNSLLAIEDYEFSHAAPYANYANGFTPSKVNDLKNYGADMWQHSYASLSGGGVKGQGTPYLVGYWDAYTESQAADQTFNSKSCRFWEEDQEPFMPQSVMVNNNTYMYYYVTGGIASSFKKGDYVKLIAHGVHADGSESTASIDLVNYNKDDIEECIIKDWTEFDLSGLGICTGVYFTIDSSDANEYGLLVPAYFCIDKLVVKD